MRLDQLLRDQDGIATRFDLHALDPQRALGHAYQQQVAPACRLVVVSHVRAEDLGVRVDRDDYASVEMFARFKVRDQSREADRLAGERGVAE